MRGISRPDSVIAIVWASLAISACGVPEMNDATIDGRRDIAVTDATARDQYSPDIARSDVMFPVDVAVICPTNEDGIVRAIIRPSCATSRCHTATARAGELDLESANLVDRLSNAPAVGCPGQILIVPQNAERSYLYRKMTDPSPACGGVMPPVDAGVGLRLGEVECLRAWINGIGRVDAGPQIDVRDVPVPMDVPRDTRVDVPSAMDIVRDTPAPSDVPRDNPAPIDVPRDTPPATDAGPRDVSLDTPG
jgi:hypothetical protein